MNETISPLPASTGSAFDSIQLIRSQEYMLRRQQEMLDAAIKRNNTMTATINQLVTENGKLRAELDGYKRGKWWVLVISMLPTRDWFSHE